MKGFILISQRSLRGTITTTKSLSRCAIRALSGSHAFNVFFSLMTSKRITRFVMVIWTGRDSFVMLPAL
jgi:hypothetical protein